MRIVLWSLLALASLIVLVTVIGALLPRDHVATRIGRYRQSPRGDLESDHRRGRYAGLARRIEER